MGYHVDLVEADFTVPFEHINTIEDKFRTLNTCDSLKRGGSYNADGTKNPWFSFMNMWEDSFTAKETFECLGFDVEESDDGSLSLTYFSNKSGQEELFLMCVAPFVKDGSYLNWVGEDGEEFSHTVKDGVLFIDGVECYKNNFDLSYVKFDSDILDLFLELFTRKELS